MQIEIRDSGAGYAVDVQSHLNDKAWLSQQPGLAPLLLGLARESLRKNGNPPAKFTVEDTFVHVEIKRTL